jgi:hypothetical protein
MALATDQSETTSKPPAAQRQQSAGEVAFNRIAYTGIGFGVNEVSSLWITDQFMHGKNLFEKSSGALKRAGSWFSKEGFDGASKWLAKAFKVTDKLKNGKIITAQARAGNGLLMVTLLSGGTLLLLPMKWLEDHKVYWVKKANHTIDWMRGNKLSAEDVAKRDDEVEQTIACSPRQSWPSMLLGRVIACASSVGTGTFLIGPENNKKIMDMSEKALAGSVQTGEKSRWNRYASLIGVETYSCAISSIVLEFASKFLAKKSSRVHDPELCKAKSAPAAPVTDTADDDVPAGAATAHAEKIKSQKECGSGARLTNF